jgi:hypothetical protein
MLREQERLVSRSSIPCESIVEFRLALQSKADLPIFGNRQRGLGSDVGDRVRRPLVRELPGSSTVRGRWGCSRVRPRPIFSHDWATRAASATTTSSSWTPRCAENEFFGCSSHIGSAHMPRLLPAIVLLSCSEYEIKPKKDDPLPGEDTLFVDTSPPESCDDFPLRRTPEPKLDEAPSPTAWATTSTSPM